MDHARRAERFLVDVIPHIDVFSRSLEAPGQKRNIISYPDICSANLFPNGTYTLDKDKPLLLRANEEVFKAARDTLAAEALKLQQEYAIAVVPAYFQRDNLQLKYIPAVEITFGHDQHLLATIGREHVQIYFRTQPELPKKNVPWDIPGTEPGVGSLGKYDFHDGHCLMYPARPPRSPPGGIANALPWQGALEIKGERIFNFIVEKKVEAGNEKYVIGAPLKLDRNLVALISDGQSDDRQRHHVPAPHPSYHLSQFLSTIHE
jgi:hypothetical protein